MPKAEEKSVREMVEHALRRLGQAALVEPAKGEEQLGHPLNVDGGADDLMQPTMPEPAEIDQLGQVIREEITTAERHERSFLEHAVRAGGLLNEAKRKLKHGEWAPWLKRHNIALRTAQRCMRLARFEAKERLGPKAPRAALFDLSIRAVEELIAEEWTAEGRGKKATAQAGDGERVQGHEEIHAQDQDSHSEILQLPSAVTPASNGKTEKSPTSTTDGEGARVDHHVKPEAPTAPPVETSPVDNSALQFSNKAEPPLGPEKEPELGYFARLQEAFETVIDLGHGLGDVELGEIDQTDRTRLADLASRAEAAAHQAARTLRAPRRAR